MTKLAADILFLCIVVSRCLMAIPEAAKAYLVHFFEDTNLLAKLVGGRLTQADLCPR